MLQYHWERHRPARRESREESKVFLANAPCVCRIAVSVSVIIRAPPETPQQRPQVLAQKPLSAEEDDCVIQPCEHCPHIFCTRSRNSVRVATWQSRAAHPRFQKRLFLEVAVLGNTDAIKKAAPAERRSQLHSHWAVHLRSHQRSTGILAVEAEVKGILPEAEECCFLSLHSAATVVAG